MKHVGVMIMLLIGITASAQKVTTADTARLKFTELAHGISADYVTVSDTIPWHKRPVYQFQVVKSTDSVPAKIHTVFGVSFKITGKDTLDLACTTEWIYPQPIKEQDGNLYRAVRTTMSVPANVGKYIAYFLNEPWQLMKGKWKLNVYVENKLLYSHHFLLY